MRRHRSRVAVAIGASVATAGAMTLAVALTDGSQGSAGAPLANVVHITPDENEVGSLRELASRSDLVVHGTVLSVERGRVVDDSDVGPDTQYADVTIKVAESAKGSAPGDTVTLEQMIETGGAKVETIGGVKRAKVDDEGVWFIAATDDRNTYVLTSSQGQYLVQDDGTLGGVDVDRVEGNVALTRELLALDPQAILSRVRDETLTTDERQ